MASIAFIPEYPGRLIAASEAGFIQQYDIKGSKIKGPTLGIHTAFSSDGSRFVSHGGRSTIVQDSDSRNIISYLPAHDRSVNRYCLSPNGKFVVGVGNATAYVWNTTTPSASLHETFNLHNSDISSLTFSSSLVSASNDKLVRFWQIGDSAPNRVTMDARPTPPALNGITSVILQVEEDTTISINSAGVVGLWELSTGLCKIFFQTFEADGGYASDARLVGSVLIVAICDPSNAWKISTWNVEKEDRLPIVDLPRDISIRDLRISRDGTRAFGLDAQNIQIWSTETGRSVGTIPFEGACCPYSPTFILDGSRVWIHSENSPPQGWDLKHPRSPPLPPSDIPSDRHQLDFIQVDDTKVPNTGHTRINNTITREEVFRLPERFARPSVAQWDGRYLVAAYDGTGVLLILDFAHMIPQKRCI